MFFKKEKAGRWIAPVPHAYKMACCDCGLVHSLWFRVVSGEVQFKVYRDELLTRRQWRKRKK